EKGARGQEETTLDELNDLRLAIATARQRLESVEAQRQPMAARDQELLELIASRKADIASYESKLTAQAQENRDAEVAIKEQTGGQRSFLEGRCRSWRRGFAKLDRRFDTPTRQHGAGQSRCSPGIRRARGALQIPRIAKYGPDQFAPRIARRHRENQRDDENFVRRHVRADPRQLQGNVCGTCWRRSPG